MNGLKGWLAAAVVAATVLLVFPPDRYGFYPHCPFYETFGLLCPGCGSTRAAAALLRGHLAEAMRWNALFVATVPGLAIYGLANWRRWQWPKPRGWIIAAGLAVATVFTLARNLA